MITIRSTHETMFGANMLSLAYAHHLAQEYGLATAINRKAFPAHQLRRTARWQPNRHQRRHGLTVGNALHWR